jgi:hypothetical protein
MRPGCRRGIRASGGAPPGPPDAAGGLGLASWARSLRLGRLRRSRDPEGGTHARSGCRRRPGVWPGPAVPQVNPRYREASMRVRLTAVILALAGLLVAVAVGLAANSIASRSFTPGVDALPSAGSLAPPATNSPTAPKATTAPARRRRRRSQPRPKRSRSRSRRPSSSTRATITAGAARAPVARAAARATRAATAVATGATTSETLTDSWGVAYQRLTDWMTR